MSDELKIRAHAISICNGTPHCTGGTAHLQRWATPAIPGGHFLCEMCGGVFPGSDDDEARAEAESKGIDPDDSGLVCDACYATTPWGRSDSRSPGLLASGSFDVRWYPPSRARVAGFVARSRRRVDGVWATVKAY